MPISKEERNRILSLVESGQVNAQQAALLLDTLEDEQERSPERQRERIIRVQATSMHMKSKAHLTASIPLRLLKISIRLGARLAPQLNQETVQDLIYSVEQGASGRLLDVQDLEQGERVEVFVE